jgi:hypothetical protein
MAHHRSLENFGRTVRFRAAHYYEPHSTLELLRFLEWHAVGRNESHAPDRIRAIGSLHSWSEAARGDEVVLNLEHFSTVRVGRDGRSAAHCAVRASPCRR